MGDAVKDLRDAQAFILDLDGVVYRGNSLLPGARELVQWADETGRKAMYVSNNSFATPEEVEAKLQRLGLPSPHGRTLTAGWAAVEAIAERVPGGSVFVLGVQSVEAMAERVGLRVVHLDADGAPERAEDVRPDAVLVGLDRTLTYARLRFALRAVMAGAALYTVNRDPRLPIEDGFEPGTGAIAVALEYGSGVTAEMIGKPGPGIVWRAVLQMGVERERTLMIGDGLDLDIVAGRRAGVATALVLTGLTDAQQAAAAEGERRPDAVFADLAALLAALRGSGFKLG